MPDVATEYFDSAFDRRDRVIGKAIGVLKVLKDDYDVIACRGYSGMVIAPTLAYLMKKKLFVVRKDGEKAHSSKRHLGDLGERYLIVDDFICSGNTVKTIEEELMVAHGKAKLPEPKIVGLYLYESYRPENTYKYIPIWSDPIG